MLISRTQGTRPGRNTGRAAGVQDSEHRLAYQPVSSDHIRVHERAGHRRWSTNAVISSPSSRAQFSPSRGSLPPIVSGTAPPSQTNPTTQPQLPRCLDSIRDKHLKTDVSTQTRPPAPPRSRYRAHCCAGAAQVNTPTSPRRVSREHFPQVRRASWVANTNRHGSCTLTPSDLPLLRQHVQKKMHTGLAHW